MLSNKESGHQQPLEKESYLFKLTNLNYEIWVERYEKFIGLSDGILEFL